MRLSGEKSRDKMTVVEGFVEADAQEYLLGEPGG
jgi:hypothetical protein